RQAYGDDDIRHNVGLGSWTPRAFATFGHKSRKKDSNTEKDAVGAVRRRKMQERTVDWRMIIVQKTRQTAG
ncbi:hypothetical protein KKA33_02325, partial [Patescibacteria group bacterium]|nr:hypothetical protein [Patescibacteria group bacterium]